MIAKKLYIIPPRTFITTFDTVIKEDADVYTEDGELLLRFRKNVLKHTDGVYDALKDLARHTTTDRGVATGSAKNTPTGHKNAVSSNIIGFFDKWSIAQKAIFKQKQIQAPKNRFTTWTMENEDKWNLVTPLIQEIDAQYKLLCPTHHLKQRTKALETPFHIRGTAFSTVTVNLDFQTATHTDSGDYPEGFGNLVVLEDGEYTGAETGFPEYGIAVDVRQGDFLAMDVHRLHGNTPKVGNGHRMSLVSYLRNGL